MKRAIRRKAREMPAAAIALYAEEAGRDAVKPRSSVAYLETVV